MKRTRLMLVMGMLPLVVLPGCVTPGPEAGSFAAVEPVLERNCVHCHGKNRLKFMPAIGTSAELGKLRGDAKLIVPGKPEASRFYQVTILGDDMPGAMPPSGHAISKRETETIRRWILAGAPVPEVAVPLVPIGNVPRSR
jgi:mono/diheme cytochrome c family protein